MVRDLYGLNSSGAAWRSMFEETFRDMDFVPTVVDPDVYCRQASNPNGEYYYELLLVYVKDVLYCYQITHMIMDVLALEYDLKYGLLIPLRIFLGAETKKYQVRSEKSHWSMSITQYVNSAIKTL